MFLFLKAAKNQRVSAKLRQSKTLPWRLKAKGERPVIGIKLSQSYHPMLAAKQARGVWGVGGKQQTALQQLLCVLSCSVDHSGRSLLALDKEKGPDWLIYRVWNEVLFQDREELVGVTFNLLQDIHWNTKRDETGAKKLIPENIFSLMTFLFFFKVKVFYAKLESQKLV